MSDGFVVTKIYAEIAPKISRTFNKDLEGQIKAATKGATTVMVKAQIDKSSLANARSQMEKYFASQKVTIKVDIDVKSIDRAVKERKTITVEANTKAAETAIGNLSKEASKAAQKAAADTEKNMAAIGREYKKAAATQVREAAKAAAATDLEMKRLAANFKASMKEIEKASKVKININDTDLEQLRRNSIFKDLKDKGIDIRVDVDAATAETKLVALTKARKVEIKADLNKSVATQAAALGKIVQGELNKSGQLGSGISKSVDNLGKSFGRLSDVAGVAGTVVSIVGKAAGTATSILQGLAEGGNTAAQAFIKVAGNGLAMGAALGASVAVALAVVAALVAGTAAAVGFSVAAIVVGAVVTAVAVGLTALAGAATVALGALGGLGAALAVVGIALAPVVEAMQQFAAVQNQTPTSVNRASNAFAAQQKAVRAAESAVRSATRGLRDAKQAAEDAAQGIVNAQRGVRDAAERVAAAFRGVAQAQRSLRDASENVSEALKGVTDAQRNVRDASENVAKAIKGVVDAQRNLRDSSEAVQDALKNVISAQRGIEQANKSYQRALDGVAKADKNVAAAHENLAKTNAKLQKSRESLTRAEERAKENLLDLTRASRDAAGQEEDASIRLERAKLKLAKTSASSTSVEGQLDYREAVRDVEQAERDLADLREDNIKLQKEFGVAQAKGIAGSDEVIAAQQEIAEAQESVADAIDQITQANEDRADSLDAVRDAIQGQKDAQEGLNQAVLSHRDAIEAEADAQYQLEQAHLGVRDAEEAQKESEYQLAQAHLAVRDANEAKADAIQGVKDAQLAVRDAQEAQTDAERNLTKAKQDQVKAIEAIKDAQLALRDANANLADSHKKVSDGADLGTAASQKYGVALADLSAEGKKFVEQLQEMYFWFKDLSKIAQENLFPGLSAGLESAFKALGPTLEKGTADIAKTFGGLAKNFGAIFSDPAVAGGVGALVASANASLQSLGTGVTDFTKAVLPSLGEFATATKPVVDAFGKSISGLAPAFDSLFDSLSKGPVVEAMASIVTNIVVVLGNLLKGVGGFLEKIAPTMEKLGPSLSKNLGKFTNAVIDLFSAFTNSGLAEDFLTFMGQLGDVFKTLVDKGVIRELGDTMGKALIAIGDGLVDLFSDPAMVQSLIELFQAMPPLISTLLQSLKILLPAFVDFVKIGADFTNEFGPMIIGVITVALVGLGAAINFITQTWKDFQIAIDYVWEQLKIFGSFLVGFGKNIIQGFWDGAKDVWDSLWKWVVDSFRGIVEFVRDLFDIHSPSRLMAEIGRFIIQGLYDGMKAIWNTLVSWFKKALEFFTVDLPNTIKKGVELAKAAWEVIQSVVKAVWQWLIDNVWNPMKTFLTVTLPGYFTSGVAAIKLAWTVAQETVAAVWRWIVENVWNKVMNFLTGTGDGTISGYFRKAVELVGKAWGMIKGAIDSVWKSVTSEDGALGKVKMFVTETIPGWFDTAIKGIKGAWGMLRDALKEPVNFVIETVFNNGIRKVWNSVVTKIPGIKPLDAIPGFATGGLLPGNSGMGFKDDRIASVKGGGNVALAGGEFVMNARSTAKYLPELEAMNKAGLPGSKKPSGGGAFATGGLIGGIEELLKSGANAVRGGLGAIADPILNKVKDSFPKVDEKRANINDFAYNVPTGVIDQIGKFIKGDDAANPPLLGDGSDLPPGGGGRSYNLGRVEEQTRNVANYLGNMFGIKTIGGYGPGSVPGSDHPAGRGLDFMTNNLGDPKVSNPVGDKLSNFIQQNWKSLNTKYIIWDKKYIGSPGSSRAYSGPSDHTDHVHMSLLPGGKFTAPDAQTGGGNADTPRGGGLTPGYQNQIKVLKDAGFNFRYSPGQLNSGGHSKTSWHYKDRAIDIGVGTNGKGNVDKAFDFLAKNYGSRSKELFYSSEPVNYKNGNKIGPFPDHFDHIHWAYATGGIIADKVAEKIANEKEQRGEKRGIQVPGFATGGYFTGAGNGTDDKNLIAISNGEFVVNAAATSQNLPLLQAINNGGQGGFGAYGYGSSSVPGGVSSASLALTALDIAKAVKEFTASVNTFKFNIESQNVKGLEVWGSFKTTVDDFTLKLGEQNGIFGAQVQLFTEQVQLFTESVATLVDASDVMKNAGDVFLTQVSAFQGYVSNFNDAVQAFSIKLGDKPSGGNGGGSTTPTKPTPTTEKPRDTGIGGFIGLLPKPIQDAVGYNNKVGVKPIKASSANLNADFSSSAGTGSSGTTVIQKVEVTIDAKNVKDFNDVVSAVNGATTAATVMAR